MARMLGVSGMAYAIRTLVFNRGDGERVYAYAGPVRGRTQRRIGRARERAYVSRLWAEDWASAEDAAAD